LPRLDAAIFADTQWEPEAVYKHLRWLLTEAKSYGIPVWRGTRGDLRADAIEFRRSGGKASGEPGSKRYASMPLFVAPLDGGRVGMIKRQCTREYKIELIEGIIRRELLGLKPGQRAPAGAVRLWFGISVDEASRRRKSLDHWQTFYYPLIDVVESPRKDTLFGRGFDRQDCLDWLAANGYPRPPRSACIGCPYRSDAEWLAMKRERPAEWLDAVAFDKEIRAASAALQASGNKKAIAGQLVGLPFVHRSCQPLDEAILAASAEQAVQRYGMENECSGMCGV
jgi:hypothetical protein